MSKNRRNYYRILHVQPDAPTEIIKTSYRTLMQKLRCHPDLGGDDWNAALLNEALAVLTDASKRAAYDARCKLNPAGPREKKGRSRSRQQAQADPTMRESNPWSTPNNTGGRGAGSYQTELLKSCLFCGARSNEMSSCNRCHSPLQLPPPTGEPSPDQRAFERQTIEAKVEVFVHWPQERGYPAVVRDLTPSGMQVVLSVSLEINQIIKISSEFIGSVCRVVNCNVDEKQCGFTIGLEFLSLCFHKPRGRFVSEKA